jgi:hypothetical protein
MTAQDKAASVINSRAARHIHRPFTALEIASEAAIDLSNARKIITTLVRKGHLRRVSAPIPSRANLGRAKYELVRMIPTRPPVARVKIWRSMRMMRRFTIADLCATAEAQSHNVKTYLGALINSGYIRKLKRQAPKRGIEGHAVYALVKDTGPLAPQRVKGGTIFDPNVAVDEEGGGGCGNQNTLRGCAPNAIAPTRRLLQS